MLHISPEPELSRQLSALKNLDYVSADLYAPAMVKTDICNMCFEDDSFDVIYCSHVLNMVDDDTSAMRELHRVLRSSGWGLIQIPVMGATTVEPCPSSPQSRREAFGDPDIRRLYGTDVQAKLEGIGFSLQNIRLFDEIPARQRIRCGIHDQELFLLTKQD